MSLSISNETRNLKLAGKYGKSEVLTFEFILDLKDHDVFKKAVTSQELVDASRDVAKFLRELLTM